jgi:drug/metabolite transporter (DMT)-like permease
VLWGSTYLAIRFAVATLPPFLMAGVRFVIAGGALYLWSRRKGAPPPTMAQWRATAVVGGLLLLGGNGGVVWAERHVSSGLAALLVALLPLWMVLLDALRGGPRPTRAVIAGLLLGMGGLAVLVGPDRLAGDERPDLWGSLALLLASLSWAVGSLHARRADLPKAPLLATAMEMICGGALLLLGSCIVDPLRTVRFEQISAASLWAVLYLIVFGSLIGFSAYTWLLRVSTPARVSTYAYVNPVIAVLLGWAAGGETLGLRTLLAAAIILAGVVVITLAGRDTRDQDEDQDEDLGRRTA